MRFLGKGSVVFPDTPNELELLTPAQRSVVEIVIAEGSCNADDVPYNGDGMTS
jgi:hypothetical protein